MDSPLGCFEELKDPRMEWSRDHLPEGVLRIAIAVALSGAKRRDDEEECGEAKKDWLRTFLQAPGGVPSHDSFSRGFATSDS